MVEITEMDLRPTGVDGLVVLQMKQLGLGDPERFPFMEPPDPRALADGRRLLEELTALAPDGSLTDTGRRMAQLPVDPRLARMLLAADRHGSLKEVLAIVAALAIQDPRERPAEKRQEADEAHAAFADERSDFLALVNLWDWFERQRKELGSSALRRTVQHGFLSWMRMREWQALHRQLRLACREQGLGESTAPADYAAVHRALLAGLLSLIGMQTERREYLGARGRKFQIFPGSHLFKRPPRWVMAAEIVETSRVYARTVAEIDPRWIEPEAQHLLRRSHSEPHWHRKRGQVMAFERVTLYGLALVERRRVGYAGIDPDGAREIFLRRALVEGALDTRGRFLEHNRALLDSIRDLEARIRRRDLAVDEEDLLALYAERVPAEICSARGFERWRREAEARDPDVLRFSREELLRRRPQEASERDYPGTLELAAGTFRLRYTFAPGSEADGVTVQVPRGALGALRPEPLEWLVPGMLEEKCVALLRALPKQTRKALAPVPDHVGEILPELLAPERFRQGSLLRALAAALERRFAVAVPPAQWRTDPLEPHLLMRVEVLDGDGRVVAHGRDLPALQRTHAARGAVASSAGAGLPIEGLTDWSFGELPERMVGDDGVALWPALLDEGDQVAVRAAPGPEAARRRTRHGVQRLALLRERRTVRWLRRNLADRERLQLLYAPLGTSEGLLDQLLRVGAREAFPVDVAPPRDAAAFERLLAAGRNALVPATEAAARTALAILERWQAVRLVLEQLDSPAFRDAVDDERAHLARLITPDFLVATPADWLPELPRYLDAARWRLEHLQGNVERDRDAVAELEAWRARVGALEAQAGDPPPEALATLPWLLEEYRVSRFAQKLGTAVSVSPKRLKRRLQEAEREVHLGRG